MVGWITMVAAAWAADTVEVRLDGSVMLITPAAYLDTIEVVGDPVVEVRPTGRPGVVHLVGIRAGEAELAVRQGSGGGLPFTYDVRVAGGAGPRRVRVDVPVGTFIVFETPRPVDYMSTSNANVAEIRAWGTDPAGQPVQLITSRGPGRTDLVLLLEDVQEPLYYEVVSTETDRPEVIELSGRGWVPLGLPSSVSRPEVSDAAVAQLKKRRGEWSIRARQAGTVSVAAWVPNEEKAWLRHFAVAD